MLFQDICAAKLNWDDTLSEELLTKWNVAEEITTTLHSSVLLQQFHWIHFLHMCLASYSLIGFCDASQKAYATVVFLRMRSADNLVASRTRVAPLGTQTIPCLELLSALLLASLLSGVTQAIFYTTIAFKYHRECF